MSIVLAPIVEGHGDCIAVPRLLHRLLEGRSFRVANPVRFPKSRLAIQSELIRAVRIAESNRKADEALVVVVVVDADADCIQEMSKKYREAMSAPSLPRSLVAFPQREFENWLIAGLAQFDHPDADLVGSPKERLRRVNNNRYSETVDQPGFVQRIDIDLALARSRSFRRLCERLRALVPMSP
jgi:hypothetical protein